MHSFNSDLLAVNLPRKRLRSLLESEIEQHGNGWYTLINVQHVKEMNVAIFIAK